MHAEIAIIGAGPAGTAAAVQLKRSNFTPLVFEATRIGGLLHSANLIENYPGFPEGIRGADLAGKMADHLQTLGVQTHPQKVERVSWENNLFSLHTPTGIHSCYRLVVASGTLPLHLPEGMVQPAAQSKVLDSLLPLQTAPSGKVIIIGGGDAAYDYAVNLAVLHQVMILQRGAISQALPLLVQRASQNPQIIISPSSIVYTICARANQVCVAFTSPSGDCMLAADWVLTAIGRRPNLDFFDLTITSSLPALQQIGRLYLVGDVKNGKFRQAAIAAGDGLRAAMEICLSKENDHENRGIFGQ